MKKPTLKGESRMNYEQKVHFKQLDVYHFWRCIEDSYNIECMYEETENVKVILHDKYSTCTFLYFKGKNGGRGIRILDDEGEYAAVLWMKSKGIGGFARDERGKRKFLQMLKMFRKAHHSGRIDIIVEKSDVAPSAKVPLTDFEKQYISMLEQGITGGDKFTPNKIHNMRRSLRQKGVDLSVYDKETQVV